MMQKRWKSHVRHVDKCPNLAQDRKYITLSQIVMLTIHKQPTVGVKLYFRQLCSVVSGAVWACMNSPHSTAKINASEMREVDQ